MLIELPFVSICMPTYNGELYHWEALHSVITQYYRPTEVVVSDAVNRQYFVYCYTGSKRMGCSGKNNF